MRQHSPVLYMPDKFAQVCGHIVRKRQNRWGFRSRNSSTASAHSHEPTERAVCSTERQVKTTAVIPPKSSQPDLPREPGIVGRDTSAGLGLKEVAGILAQSRNRAQVIAISRIAIRGGAVAGERRFRLLF
jgi:hypothetical protein